MPVNLTQAAEALAVALSTVSDVAVQAAGPVFSPRPGDGWVTIGRMSPEGYGDGYLVVLQARVVMHHELAQAEVIYRQKATQLLQAVLDADLGSTDVSIEPAAFLVGEIASPLYCAEVTISLEVVNDA